MVKLPFAPIVFWLLKFACVVQLWMVMPGPACADEPANQAELFARLKIVVSRKDSMERQLALMKINNQALYRTLARSEADLELAYLATALLTDENDLKERALAPHALIRLVAVACISDEYFLLSRILGREEKSPAVRRAIVARLRNPALLAEAAQGAFHQDVRSAAAKRVMDPELAAKVQAAKTALGAQVAQIERLEHFEDLMPYLAAKSKHDVLAAAAARSLRDQRSLASAALVECDYAVEKIIIQKLTDRTLLNKVAAEAADPAMRLAAKAKVDFHVLGDSIKQATLALAKFDSPNIQDRVESIRKQRCEGEIQKLADTAGALALLVECLSLDYRQVKDVFYQLRGYEYRIGEIIDLIYAYGDLDAVDVCLHSGQPDLEDTAYKWYERHGYDTSKLNGPLQMRRL